MPPAGGPWHTTVLADHPLVGRIFDPRAGIFVSEETLRARVLDARFVLLGEKHDDPDHHRLQAALLGAVLSSEPRGALVLEMIDVDQQPEVDATLAAAPRDADALARAVHWEERGWPSFAQYRPLIEVAMASSAPVLGGNYPTTAIRASFHPGATPIDPAELARLGVAQPLAPSLARSMIEELDADHCGMLGSKSDFMPKMVLAQRLRDGQMAATMAATASGTGGAAKVVLVAGAGHVRTDRGVPTLLHARYGVAGARIASIAFVEVERGVLDPAAYAAPLFAERLPFDLVWFTPRVDEKDPCASMHAK